jgi:hypothetical protein
MRARYPAQYPFIRRDTSSRSADPIACWLRPFGVGGTVPGRVPPSRSNTYYVAIVCSNFSFSAFRSLITFARSVWHPLSNDHLADSIYGRTAAIWPERAMRRLLTPWTISLCSSSIYVTNTTPDVFHPKDRISYRLKPSSGQGTILLQLRRSNQDELLPRSGALNLHRRTISSHKPQLWPVWTRERHGEHTGSGDLVAPQIAS